MLVVPVDDRYAQTLSVTLAEQDCTLNLYQKTTGFYCDVLVSDTLIIGGVICRNRVRIVRERYLGFAGDLAFCDMQGNNDPISPGLGSRYLLLYLDVSDLAGAGQ